MALRDFLYPQLEVRLLLARALDVDEAQVSHGTLSNEYEEVAARIIVSTRDAQRLGIKEDNCIEVNSETGTVIVKVRIKDEQPEGIVVMQPSPWAFAVIESMVPSQGTKVIIKPSEGPVTSSTDLP